MLGNPTIAFLASGVEAQGRITAKAVDDQTAEAMLDAEEAVLRTLIGHVVFCRRFHRRRRQQHGVDRDGAVGRSPGLTVAVAESLTAGVRVGAVMFGAGAKRVVRSNVDGLPRRSQAVAPLGFPTDRSSRRRPPWRWRRVCAAS
ncbi:MAG: hypothetical protein R2706_03820 [Acidimicrobiales bacterium]